MRATQRKNRRTIALVASSLIIIAHADQAQSFSLQSVLLKGGGRQESPSRVVLSDDFAGNELHAEATFSTLEPAYVQPLHSQGQLTLPYRLSLSPAATIPRKQPKQQHRLLPSAVKQPKKPLDRFLLAIFATYLCSMFALSIPAVMLVPVIASDPTSHALALSSAPDLAASASFLAKMVGLGTFGGAVGKSVNGFVCQALGGRLTSRLYFLGLATSSLLLSQCRQSFHGAAIFMIEFFSSVSWTACTLMLASAYQNSPERFTKGMTVLSLASTLGALFTKGAGIIMLQHFHWRNVCNIAAAVALCGACVVHAFIKEHDLTTESDRLRASIRQRAGLKPASKPKQVIGIVNSLRDVLTSQMFWMVGLGHGMGFLARRSDAFLGSFLAAVCDVPAHLCGGFTASVTLGFIFGLKSNKRFYSLTKESEKEKFVRRGYNISAAAAFGLALCANNAVSTFLGRKLTTLAIIGASFCMSSSISFQFYQLPAKCATLFADSKAVCISFLDGLAFLIGAPIWYCLGWIISKFGWSAAWAIIAGFLALGGKVMTRALPDVLEFES